MKTWWWSSRGTSPAALSTTTYGMVGCGPLFLSTTESYCQTPIGTAGTLGDFTIRIPTNGNTCSGNTTVTLRVNGGGVLTITIPAGQVGEFTAPGTYAVPAGAQLSFAVVVGGGTSALVIAGIGVSFTPTDPNISVMRYFNGQTAPAAIGGDTATYLAPSRSIGSGTANTNEANERVVLGVAGTLRSFYVRVSANARTSDTFIKLRVNGADSGIGVTIAASSGGVLASDLVNTVALTATDSLCALIDTQAGSGNFSISMISYELESTSAVAYVATADGTGQTVNPSASFFTTLAGRFGTAIATETDLANKSNVAATLTRLAAYFSANTLTGGTAIKLRAAGGDAMSLAIPDSTSGLREATGTVAIGANDALAFQVTGGSGGTSAVLQHIVATLSLGAPAAAPIFGHINNPICM